MNIWNLNVKRGADGSKHLDVQMHGIIDGGWFDENPVNTAATIAELQQHLDAKTIGVRINSMGGSAFGGVAMYNALQAHPGEVTCTVEGLAASAASLVAMAGKCVMGRGAMMMIHKPSAGVEGNADDLRRTADALDKIQTALAGIYTEKTGKPLDEISALLDDETWMTADEAVAAGFADSIATKADTDAEPDPDDPNEGNEDEPPEDRGDAIVWNGVAFPRESLPLRITAMAKPPASQAAVDPAPSAVGSRPASTAPGATAIKPVLALVPSPAPQPPITRAELTLRAPELVAALIEEGKAAGVAVERARLQAIDDLDVRGAPDLIAAAKYGPTPTDAATLAIAVVKAQRGAGAELLAARRLESAPVAAVAPGIPDQTAAAESARLVNAIVAGGNARRGGTVR